jgi:putative endonuclease
VPTLARNLRCRAGEIDLVARDGPVLVFVEVRQRRDRRYGGAAASVNRAKQARLIRAARYFLPVLSRAHFAGVQPPCRFDVVSIEDGRIDWIRDAFRM